MQRSIVEQFIKAKGINLKESQVEFVQLLLTGMTNKEIYSEHLYTSKSTFDNKSRLIYARFNVLGRLGLLGEYTKFLEGIIHRKEFLK